MNTRVTTQSLTEETLDSNETILALSEYLIHLEQVLQLPYKVSLLITALLLKCYHSAL